LKKEEICARIKEIGIIPSIRVSLAEDARFAAKAISEGGIPILEITLTVPGAISLISGLAQSSPELIVGAGDVSDTETARHCLDAGATFLTSPTLDLEIVEFAVKENVVALPGAMTPTEVKTAWKAGADFVKVFPCAQVGGESYIRALRGPFPHIPLIASGGVNQKTAYHFILSGATALGIGRDLVSQEAIHLRQAGRIVTLATRYLNYVKDARSQLIHPR